MSGRGAPDSMPASDYSGSGRILIICETRDGRAIKPSLETAGEARSLADRFVGCNGVDAVVCGAMEAPGSTLGSVGIDTVYLCPSLTARCDPHVSVATLGTLVQERPPLMIVCAHTLWGADLAVRLAVELQAPLIANCLQILDVSQDKLSALQSVQDGRLHQECSIVRNGPVIASWDPDSLGTAKAYEGHFAQVQALPLSHVSCSDAVRSVRYIEGDARSMPLEEADRIVAFGRGMDPEDLQLLQELADSLRASMGGTRPVIDAGLLPFERQIGQTGVSVSPKLLMAWGISGANEFTVGVEEAETILSINTDPQARMFMLSDLGLVGDGETILRALLEHLKRKNADAGARAGDMT